MRIMHLPGQMHLLVHWDMIEILTRFNCWFENSLKRLQGMPCSWWLLNGPQKFASSCNMYSELLLCIFLCSTNLLLQSTIKIPGSEVIPIPLFHPLNGRISGDYVARVEPSATGGRKMAEYMLWMLFIVQGMMRDRLEIRLSQHQLLHS